MDGSDSDPARAQVLTVPPPSRASSLPQDDRDQLWERACSR
ncbi:hypothetical protein [Pseudomonas sp. FG-3G]|nr:hypothetical protein [Pseudomonas sp. FG-3G]